MASLFNQTKIVNEIASNMLSSQRVQYQEDFIIHQLCQHKHLQHINFYLRNGFSEKLKSTLFFSEEASPNCCVLYLHGFGSNRLEGSTLLSTLPKQIALCCFDFSGSGKSQGNLSTYGYKQYQDIKYMIEKLKQMGYTKIVLWGRSMGAVASLLYTSNYNDPNVIFQVIDSPFSSFENIACYFAKQSMNLPQLFIKFGISVLKQHFKQHEFNPFKINVLSVVKRCHVPALFVYSENDKVILPENTINIINNFNPDIRFEKLIIDENHNNIRSKDTLKNIFGVILKYRLNESTIEKKKTKRGLFEVISSQMTPRTNRTSETDQQSKTKLIQCSLSKKYIRKNNMINQLRVMKLEKTIQTPPCFNTCRK